MYNGVFNRSGTVGEGHRRLLITYSRRRELPHKGTKKESSTDEMDVEGQKIVTDNLLPGSYNNDIKDLTKSFVRIKKDSLYLFSKSFSK